MKRFLYAVFALICAAVLVVPSLGMLFNPTDKPIGNERATALPSFTDKDGKANLNYFSDLGGYFEKHFAFRPQMIQADAEIQSGVFRSSNIDTVLVGSDDWLYYTSSSDDFLGRNTLSKGEISGVVHNLGLIQSFAQAQNVNFLFSVAPNKNTLYPDHMPYTYSAKVSDTHNRDLLHEALRDSGVHYCNLFEPLAAQNETLYFERDSHWNNKGALLAYNTMLDQLGKAHEDFSGTEVVREKSFTGDLAKMLFPVESEPEYDYNYGAQQLYTYVTDTKSVEDTLIRTQSDAQGTLYMYRDSFGNALVPFFATAYGQATFTKSFPMNIRQGLAENKPDTFVMELVERNIPWLLTMPPMMPAPQLGVYQTQGVLEATVSTEVKPCTFAAEYTEITGTVACQALSDDAVYCVTVTDSGGAEKTFEAFNYKSENGDGFLAYLPADQYPAESVSDVKILVKNNGEYFEIRA
ncbi:MAG: hypothetical protein IJ598_11285 [Ruminococcus sp.]|nr:hypothetical protein [Ruminococcus sp.]